MNQLEHIIAALSYAITSWEKDATMESEYIYLDITDAKDILEELYRSRREFENAQS